MSLYAVWEIVDIQGQQTLSCLPGAPG
ncbi:unnamed protein product [Ectocarpus sp. CCAP 1310/34]|nr:unnamed protein product [Ectocarpus sp. CCAP 1310/34]